MGGPCWPPLGTMGRCESGTRSQVGRSASPLTGHTGRVRGVWILPGADASGGADGRTCWPPPGGDGTVRIWDPITGRQVGQSRPGTPAGYGQCVPYRGGMPAVVLMGGPCWPPPEVMGRCGSGTRSQVGRPAAIPSPGTPAASAEYASSGDKMSLVARMDGPYRPPPELMGQSESGTRPQVGRSGRRYQAWRTPLTSWLLPYRLGLAASPSIAAAQFKAGTPRRPRLPPVYPPRVFLSLSQLPSAAVCSPAIPMVV